MSGFSFLFCSKEPAPAVPPCSLGFPEIIRRSLEPRRAVWRSRLLSASPLIHQGDPMGRCLKILTDLSGGDTTLGKQLRKYLLQQRELAGGGVWARYLESYDTIVAFAEPYRKMLQFAEEALPAGDVVLLDVAAATLNFSLYLVLKSPERRMIAVDDSRIGMLLGRKKLELAIGREHLPRHRAFASSLMDPLFPAKNVDGAVVSNLLGRVTDRKAALTRLHGLLKPGAILVWIEPTDRFRSPERMRKYLVELAASALANRSPMNEFDLALVAGVHLETFTAALYHGPALLPPRELEGAVRNAGFDVMASRPFLAGTIRCLKLKRL